MKVVHGFAAAFLFLALVAPASETNPAGLEFFEKNIRPVLAENCYECHNSSGKKKGDIALDYRGALMESDVIVAGHPEKSRLLSAIRHEEGFEAMPSKAPKLSNLTIGNFEEWIRMGAPDPRETKPTEKELASQVDWNMIRDKRAEWWSFQPLKDHSAPPPRIRSGMDRTSTGSCMPP
jgi:mono/diheme cytochrome c family protein